MQTQLKQWQPTIAPLPQTENQSTQTSQKFEDLFTQLERLEQSKVRDQNLGDDQTLRASEEKWCALSACSLVGIFTCNVERWITYTNPRCRELGFTLEESLGEGFSRVIHSEDRDRVVSEWVALAKAGQQHADELRVADRDGEVMWMNVRTAPIVSDLGELLGHTGTIKDLTKQKQADAQITASLREKEVLLKEIHHPVKNTLQIISSLIYLQSQCIEDPKCGKFLKIAKVELAQWRSCTTICIDRKIYLELIHQNIFKP